MSEAVLVGLLTADRVIVEEKNKKKTIVGTFSRMAARRFPVVFPPWYIYAAVTNIAGEHAFTLRLFHSVSEKVLLPITGQIRSADRRTVVELVFAVGRVVFPEEGTYNLIFSVDDLPIGSRLLEVVTQAGREPPPGTLQSEEPQPPD